MATSEPYLLKAVLTKLSTTRSRRRAAAPPRRSAVLDLVGSSGGTLGKGFTKVLTIQGTEGITKVCTAWASHR